MSQTFRYRRLENRNFLLLDLLDPEANKTVSVEMKDLSYKELLILQEAQKPSANVVDETYKIFAGIIVSWDGEPRTLTTIELKNKGYEVYRTLEKALQEFFLGQITFILES